MKNVTFYFIFTVILTSLGLSASAQWNQQASGTTYEMRSIYMLNENKGFNEKFITEIACYKHL